MTKPTAGLTRRSALAAFGSATVASPLVAPASAQSASRTFVLVHGAWHGGWCWQRVSDRLERKGHKVFAPSLTGLGDRSHLISQQVNVTTHITDIANLIRYGICVMSCWSSIPMPASSFPASPKKRREAIRSIVFLDAYVPLNGQSVLSLGSQGMRDNVNAAIKRGQTGSGAGQRRLFQGE